jgi:hypothetical protein
MTSNPQLFISKASIGANGGLRPFDGTADLPYSQPPPPVDPPPIPPSNPTLTQVFEDQFGGSTVDKAAWAVYDNNNFGSPDRIQLYRGANITTGPGASAGATNGTSMRLQVKKETLTLSGAPKSPGGGSLSGTFDFTSGMVDTQSVGHFFPRYGRVEFRCKIPHGQGIWPSIWITAAVGGASTVEYDIMEYFHVQLPGYNSSSLHGRITSGGKVLSARYTNNGNVLQDPGKWGRSFFEHPTYTPGWHTFACEIYPVTDSSGATVGDITQSSANVRFVTYIDGVRKFDFVDVNAAYWSSTVGDDNGWQIYMQGCQVDGLYVGHPDDPLGYAHNPGVCGISGTPPNTCTVTRNGTDYVQRAQYGPVSSSLEVDYVKWWKRTAA